MGIKRLNRLEQVLGKLVKSKQFSKDYPKEWITILRITGFYEESNESSENEGSITKKDSDFSKWASLVAKEIDNPLTFSVDITRDIGFDEKYPEPYERLVVVIKQRRTIEEFGTKDIHKEDV